MRKHVLLKDACARIKSGKSIKSNEISNAGLFPVYGGNGVRGFTDHKNFSGDCAIVGRQGAYCGNVRYFKGDAYMTEHAVVIQANNDNNTRYLSYLLACMDLGRLSGQSAQPGLSVRTLSNQEIELPSYEEQKKVVSILSVLDDKILVNNQINKNLEQQARALFHQWIASTSSTIYRLSDIADINPETYSPKDNWRFVNYLDTSSIIAGTITGVQYILPSKEKLPSRARRILRKNDIVFSTVRPNQLHYGILLSQKNFLLNKCNTWLSRAFQHFLRFDRQILMRAFFLNRK